MRWSIAFPYPAVLFAAYLMDTFTRWPMPANALIRPTLAVVAVALLLQLGLTLAIRQRHLAAYATAVMLALFLGVEILLLGLIILGGTTAMLVFWWDRRRGTPSAQRLSGLTAAGRFVSVVMLVVTVVTTVTSDGFRLEELLLPQARIPAMDVVSDVPDIYVIVLDGYPRQDTLGRFGHDNEPFLGDLAGRGFTVDRESQSNYAKTWFTLASMFQMKHLEELELPVIARPADEIRAMNRALNEATSLDMLASRGYEIVSVPPPFADVQLWDVTDRQVSSRLNTFEIGLLEGHLPPPISRELGKSVFAEHARGWNSEAFARWRRIARVDHPAPRFVFIHAVAPHTPLVHDRDGATPFTSACFPVECTLHEHKATALGWTIDEFWDGYAEQVAWTNEQVLTGVDAVIANAPDSVIVLLSDHGSRYAPDDDPAERFLNFFAARTPGHPDLFGAGSTPVNILSTMLNAYLGTHYPMRADTRYSGDLPHLERLPD